MVTGIPEAQTRNELAMSDEEFKKNYLESNATWWRNFEEYHHGKIPCAECGRVITRSKTLRPFGGKNYDPRCFKKFVLQEMKYYFGLDGEPLPSRCLEFEWMLRVTRVMDGGLVKLAETDIDLVEA